MDFLNILSRRLKNLRSTETIACHGEIFGELEYPRRVKSDQGKAFTGKVFKAFMTGKEYESCS